MKKKLIAIILCTIITLSGCSSKEPEVTTSKEVTPTITVVAEEVQPTEAVQPKPTEVPVEEESTSVVKSVDSESLKNILWVKTDTVNAAEDYVPFVATTEHANGTVRDMTSVDFVAGMGIGWNLGNTMEACGGIGTTVNYYETSWGNPQTTKEMIDGLKEVGFDTLRIPVAWSNLMSEDFTIRAELLDRIEEIAGYALDNDMYVIVNIHWDNGWFAKFTSKPEWAMEKYTAVWLQVSERFKNYSDHLILESLNEEGAWADIWNHYGGIVNKHTENAYQLLNTINQKFVDIVRASSGNNATRFLLIAGYNTDIINTCREFFAMPEDQAKHLMISVHYYNPSTFTILEKDAGWGDMRTTWGTLEDMKELNYYMQMMKDNFLDKGYGVIVGEFGNAVPANKDAVSVRKYTQEVCKMAYKMGFCPVFWDNGAYYNRTAAEFNDPELAAIFTKIAE